MFNFLKNDILKILDITQKERDDLLNHQIYNSIDNILKGQDMTKGTSWTLCWMG